MDRFGGARYSSYTLRRFYPMMVGENLTFAPSQYSGIDYAGTQREKSESGSGFDIVSGLTEFATGFAAEYLRGKLTDSQLDRELEREQSRSRMAQIAADAEARRIALNQPSQQQQAKPMNILPWVLGGVGVLATVAVAGIVLTKKKAAPASQKASSSRRASRK